MPIDLEVCVDTWAGAQVAALNGADRIELCADLGVGGLTPGVALMRKAAGLPIPVYAMIRPRGGNFDYSGHELDQMVQSISAARSAGLAGVVFGAARGGELDLDALARLCAVAKGLGKTLHRVVDELASPIDAVTPAIELGFERILTSGGAETALAGAPVIADMVQRAGGAISIMPGAGIGPQNAHVFLGMAGIAEIHGSFSVRGADGRQETDAATIRAMRAVLDRADVAG